VPEPTNGWRNGRDPVQLRLRAIAAITCLAVFVYLVVDRRPITEALPMAMIAVAALLILLGYERIARLPGFDRRDRDDD
jgi:hypothetical protein